MFGGLSLKCLSLTWEIFQFQIFQFQTITWNFTPVSSRHVHFTRFSRNNYVSKFSRNNYGRHSPSNYAIQLWSALDDYIKQLPISNFKKELREALKHLYEIWDVSGCVYTCIAILSLLLHCSCLVLWLFDCREAALHVITVYIVCKYVSLQPGFGVLDSPID